MFICSTQYVNLDNNYRLSLALHVQTEIPIDYMQWAACMNNNCKTQHSQISPPKSRCITVSHIGHHIVNKRQMVFDIFGGPVSPVEV